MTMNAEDGTARQENLRLGIFREKGKLAGVREEDRE